LFAVNFGQKGVAGVAKGGELVAVNAAPCQEGGVGFDGAFVFVLPLLQTRKQPLQLLDAVFSALPLVVTDERVIVSVKLQFLRFNLVPRRVAQDGIKACVFFGRSVGLKEDIGESQFPREGTVFLAD
jgi:hypothetical protein